MGKAMGRLPGSISRICPNVRRSFGTISRTCPNVRRSLGRLIVFAPM